MVKMIYDHPSVSTSIKKLSNVVIKSLQGHLFFISICRKSKIDQKAIRFFPHKNPS